MSTPEPETLSARERQIADAYAAGNSYRRIAERLFIAPDWPRLMRRSFMGEAGQGIVQMHSLMREALQAQEKAERPANFVGIHGWLFEHFDARARPEDARSVTEGHERAFLRTLEHLAPKDVMVP